MGSKPRTWVAAIVAVVTMLSLAACGGSGGPTGYAGHVLTRFHTGVTVAGTPAGSGTPISAGQRVATDVTGALQFAAGKLTCRQFASTDVIVQPSSGVLLRYSGGGSSTSTVTCSTSQSGPCHPRCKVDAGHILITMADPLFTVLGYGSEITVRVAAGSLTLIRTGLSGSVTLNPGQQMTTVGDQLLSTPIYFDLADLPPFEQQAFHELRSSDPQAELRATTAAGLNDKSFTCGSQRPSLTVTGQIASDQPTTLTYQWQRSDGTQSGLYSMYFTRPGVQQAQADTWTPPTDNFEGTDTLKVYGVSAASASSEPANVRLRCTPASATIMSVSLTSFTTSGTTASATWHVTTDTTDPFTFTAEFAQTRDTSTDITTDDNYYAAPAMTESGQTSYDIPVTWQYNACLPDPLVVTLGTASGAGAPVTTPLGITKKTGSCIG